MIRVVRDLLIGVAAFLGAVLVAGLGQGALELALPSLSNQSVGLTNVATSVFVILLGVMFFLVGAIVPRWLRTSVPLVWLLLPVLAIYSLGFFGQPYLYRCNPISFVDCWVVLSPFLVSFVSVALGFLVRPKVGHVPAYN
jgi:hypothetical protein